jgi:hypothetical protein
MSTPAEEQDADTRARSGISDLSGVDIHTDEEAAHIARVSRAKAVTIGSNIYFGSGRFDPASEEDVGLLAHELAHVEQQREKGEVFVGRDPTDPQPPSPAEQAQTMLFTDVSTELARAALPPDKTEDFLSRLQDDVTANLTSLVPEPALSEILDRVEQLALVEAEVDGEYFDYVTALQLLVRVLGLPPGTGVQKPSYGVAGFIREVSRDISHFLAIPVADKATAALYPQSTDVLSSWLALILEQLTSVRGVLELELEGTLARLIALRVQMAAAAKRDDAAAVGVEIGETARRALLLSSAIGNLDEDDDPTLALEDRLTAVTPEIDAIRVQAADEKTTLEALGNRPQLLRPTDVEPTDFILASADPTVVAPEEAFPQASDRATLDMLDDLAARVSVRASTAESLRASVVPQSPSYGLDEFALVYGRWFTFFSPAARDMDAFYQQMATMYRGIYSAMGIAGVEGGFGRALLMRSIHDYVAGALGRPSATFADELSTVSPSRQTKVSGTARDPSYEFAELYGPAPRSAAGEDTSRESALAAKAASSEQAFKSAQSLNAMGMAAPVAAQIAGLIPSAAKSVVAFHDTQASDSWNFLLRTWVVTPSLEEVNVYEQKTVPSEISRYLLAQQQLRSTLAAAHQPGFGDTPTATGGVEQGRATAQLRYLHGESETTTNPRAEADKAAIASTAQKYGIDPSKPGAASAKTPVEALIRDLEAYLDQFFAQQSAPEVRIAATLVIAQKEHKIGQQFAHYFTGPELVKAIAFVAALVGVKTMLSRFGPAGQAISAALDKGLELMGVTPGAAMVALLAWLIDTGRVSTFSDARVQAFFSWGVADDLGQLAQQYAIQGVVAGIQLGAMRGPEPKNLAELGDRFKPMLEDPAVRDAFLSEVDAEIQLRKDQGAGRDFSDPEVEKLESLAAHLREQSVANVRDAAEIPVGLEPVVGGTRGRDVYRMSSDPVSDHIVFGAVDGMGEAQTFAGGSTLAKTPGAAAGHYTLTVGATPVRVQVETRPHTHPYWTAPAGPHGGEAGPVRMVVERNQVTGEWSATVIVNDHVIRDDIPGQVGHELNEISLIVRDNPNATPADIAAQTESALFVPGGNTAAAPTAHDKAAALELADMGRALEDLKASHKPDPQAIRDAQARIDRMLREMGLDQGFIPNDPRTQVLRDAGVPASVRTDINNGGVTKRYSENLRSTVDPSQLVGAQPAMRRGGGVSAAGHSKSKHAIGPVEQAALLNNPDRVYTGINENGRRVDIYWRFGVSTPDGPKDWMLVTDAGMKERVITSYYEDSFQTWRARPDNAGLTRVK